MVEVHKTSELGGWDRLGAEKGLLLHFTASCPLKTAELHNFILYSSKRDCFQPNLKIWTRLNH